jgi:hypothetical protein
VDKTLLEGETKEESEEQKVEKKRAKGAKEAKRYEARRVMEVAIEEANLIEKKLKEEAKRAKEEAKKRAKEAKATLKATLKAEKAARNLATRANMSKSKGACKGVRWDEQKCEWKVGYWFNGRSRHFGFTMTTRRLLRCTADTRVWHQLTSRRSSIDNRQ